MSTPAAVHVQELSPMASPLDEPKVAYPLLADPEVPDDVKPTPGGSLLSSASPARAPPAVQKNCLIRALQYYMQPLLDFQRSFLRALYHLINFAWTITMAMIVADFIAAGIVSIIAACIGLVILYLTMELAMGLAWVDLGMTFHMVEDDKERRAAGCPRLGFRRGTLPDCSDIRNRAKSLVTDVQLYSALFYQIIAKPVVTTMTCWAFMLVVVNACGMFLWVYWLVDDEKMSKYGCVGNLTCDDDVCECHGWAMTSAGDVVLLSALALLVFPIVLRVSNFLAWCCLCSCYFFLTKVYDDETDDQQALLSKRDSAPASQPPAEATVMVQV